MLDIIDTVLRSVDIFAADLRQTNAVMLLLAFELSDLDLFAVNGTVAYSSHFADLRAHSSGQVSFMSSSPSFSLHPFLTL